MVDLLWIASMLLCYVCGVHVGRSIGHRQASRTAPIRRDPPSAN